MREGFCLFCPLLHQQSLGQYPVKVTHERLR